MFVYCECSVLSGRGLCDELIIRPEESYRLWCVVVCDLENLKNEEAMTRVGSQRHRKKNYDTELQSNMNLAPGTDFSQSAPYFDLSFEFVILRLLISV